MICSVFLICSVPIHARSGLKLLIHSQRKANRLSKVQWHVLFFSLSVPGWNRFPGGVSHRGQGAPAIRSSFPSACVPPRVSLTRMLVDFQNVVYSQYIHSSKCTVVWIFDKWMIACDWLPQFRRERFQSPPPKYCQDSCLQSIFLPTPSP